MADVNQQRTLYKRSELPHVARIGSAIRRMDEEELERCRLDNEELTLALVDWTMRDADELNDDRLLDWCLTKDRLLRFRAGGAQESADAYAARLAWRRGTLCPVIGAGVSQAAGLPSWFELVRRCLVAAMNDVVDDDSRYQLSTMLNRLGRGFSADDYSAVLSQATSLVAASVGPRFVSLVRNALSDGFTFGDNVRAPRSELHCAIANMAMHGQIGPGVRAMVTYNFDELLEITMLRHYGAVIVHSSFNGKFKSFLCDSGYGRTPITVWHPHGFVPQFALPIIFPPDLVFTEQAYEEQYGKNASFASLTHAQLLQRASCLFIGSSFTDKYQKDQLAKSHEKHPGIFHYAIFELPKQLRNRKVKHLSAAEYAEVSQPYGALGVRPLWVDSHDVVPSAVARIARSPLMQFETATHHDCSAMLEPSWIAKMYAHRPT